MKNTILFFLIFISGFSLAQNVGINQSSPTNSLHISPVNIGDNPLRIDGVQSYSIGDTSLLMINTSTGIVKYINASEFINLISNGAGLGTDDQNIDSLTLNGFNLTTFIENGNSASVDLSPLKDSILSDSAFTNNILTQLFNNADTLLYNSTFINDLRDSIDTDVDSVVLNGTTLTIYENGNGVFVDLSSLSDADADPTNELQDLSLSGNTVSLSGSSATIDLTPYLDNTDNQTLSISGNTLSISNGNSVTLTDNVNDADADPTNELQDLSLSGNTVSLSGSSATIDLSSYLDNTDNQNISGSGLSGTVLTIGIQNGTNESVNLSSLVDHDWYKVGTTSPPTSINDNIFTQGMVGIGTTTPSEKLELSNGGIQINQNFGMGFNGAIPAGGNVTGDRVKFYYDNNLFGTNQDGLVFEKTDGNSNDPDGGFLFTMKGQDNIREGVMSIRGNGYVGLGILAPAQKLHVYDGSVFAENSNTFKSATLSDDGGLELYRSNAASTPTVSGFIDFKDVSTDDSDFRIYYNNSIGTNGALQFSGSTTGLPSNSPDLIIRNSDGFIGIGTATPSDRLQVAGNIRVVKRNPSNTGTFPNYGNKIFFSGGPAPASYDSDNSDPLYIGRYNKTSDQSDLRINITDNNQYEDALAVGYTNTSGVWVERFRLAMNGQAYKAGGGSWATLSDRRTKKEIKPFSEGLDVLLKVKPVTYQYNGLYGTADDGNKYVGIIAQEVKEIAPYMVSSLKAKKDESSPEEEIYNYDGGTYMLYILVNSVKEQQKQIEQLQEQNKKLEEMIRLLQEK